MATAYNHKVVEKKWQKVWDDNKAFAATDDYSKPKYYALVEFPCWSSKAIYSTRYCSQKEKNAGL